MNIIQSIILGIVEGLTEFLPVSSTGHLILVQKLFGFSTPDLFFTIIVQAGAILASVWYFRNKLKDIFIECKIYVLHRFDSKYLTKNVKLGLWSVSSTIPFTIIAFIFKDDIENLQNATKLLTLIIALSSIIFGIFFYLVENLYYKKQNYLKLQFEVTLKDIFFMSIFQIFSLIPGVSRSGITITGGMTRKINIKESIEISFLMGIPLIFLASAYQIFSIIKNNQLDTVTDNLLLTMVGAITAFIVGLYSVKWTLGWLTKFGFKPFMYYRVGLGLLIILLLIINVLN